MIPYLLLLSISSPSLAYNILHDDCHVINLILSLHTEAPGSNTRTFTLRILTLTPR